MAATARGKRTRLPLRFLSHVLIVSGILLLADAGLTLTWQEPISALLTGRAQSRLESDFDRTIERSRGHGLPPGPFALERAAAELGARARTGEPIARIELPSLRRRYVVVQGVGELALRKGPGHYSDTPLPGQHGTIGIAGHRTTYLAPFRHNDRLRKGDPVIVTMPYARFTYNVEGTRIVQPTDTWVKDNVGHDRL